MGKGQATRAASAEPDRSGLAAGVIWNLSALAFLAIAGIALNLAVGRYYGPEILGLFNVAFAIYIAASQLAVFGLQFAALHAVSVADRTDAAELSRIVYGGLLLCSATAVVVTITAAVAAPFLVALFPRVPDLSVAWLVAVPGLIPFAINKYLLGVVNGLQHMRAYAVFQAARFVGILIGLAAMIALGAPGRYLPFILCIAEYLLAVGLVAYVLRAAPPVALSNLDAAIRRHFAFGVRVLPAGMVAELNTRVDVLMLGALMNDRTAGIYTVAALIYEAALQGIVVIRNNISPQLARDIHDDASASILRFSRRLCAVVTVLALAGAAIAVLLFPTFVALTFPGQDFMEAARPLSWLMAAFCFAAAPLCYSLIFSQAGKPGWQSLVMLVMLLTNTALNAALIPVFGIVGAGMAMGLSAVIGGLTIIVLARTVLGIRLFL